MKKQDYNYTAEQSLEEDEEKFVKIEFSYLM